MEKKKTCSGSEKQVITHPALYTVKSDGFVPALTDKKKTNKTAKGILA